MSFYSEREESGRGGCGLRHPAACQKHLDAARAHENTPAAFSSTAKDPAQSLLRRTAKPSVVRLTQKKTLTMMPGVLLGASYTCSLREEWKVDWKREQMGGHKWT